MCMTEKKEEKTKNKSKPVTPKPTPPPKKDPGIGCGYDNAMTGQKLPKA